MEYSNRNALQFLLIIYRDISTLTDHPIHIDHPLLDLIRKKNAAYYGIQRKTKRYNQ
jgi:hypothetical protein